MAFGGRRGAYSPLQAGLTWKREDNSVERIENHAIDARPGGHRRTVRNAIR